MKKLTSVVMTALTAVFLACAFSACNNLNGTGNAPVIEGCYSGSLTPSSGLDPFTLTIFVRSDGFVNFYDEHDDFDGTVTLNGHGFTVTGTSARSEVTWNITGTVSSDGLKLCNITINGDRYDGELTLQDVHLFGIFAGEVSRSGEEPFGVSISSFNYSDEGNSCSFTIGTVSFPEAELIVTGNGFTVTGTSDGVTRTVTGTVSFAPDGLELKNIIIDGKRYNGTLTQRGLIRN